MTKEFKIRKIAESFMAEDPEEYAGETIDDVMAQLRQASPKFIDFTFNAYHGEEMTDLIEEIGK